MASAVDQIAAADASSPTRSDVLRKAIEAYVRAERRKFVDESIVAAYTNVPQSTTDEWGSLTKQQEERIPRIGTLLDAEDGGW